MNVRPKRFLRSLLQDEGGQATSEYILMLVISVGLFMILLRKVLRPGFDRLQSVLTARLEKTLFGGSGFHHFPVGR